MEITKEKVLEKAKELGLTLTDDEAEKYVKDGKLPEKSEDELEKAEVKDLVKIIKEMRQENAERRVANKKLEDKLKELDKDKEKQKQKDLEEQGKWKELYEAELAKVKEFEPKVTEYTEYQNVKRETLKKQLGDKWIDSFASTPLTELEVLAGKLTETKEQPNSSNHKGSKPQENKPLFNYTSMKN